MEIGSEYSLDLSELNKKDNCIYDYLASYNSLYFDSGRSALKALLKMQFDIKVGSVLLPEYICKSVIECFEDHKIDFFAIKSDFTIDIDSFKSKLSDAVSIIYICHYFGKVQPIETLNKIKDLAKKNGAIIIEDTTHSILSNSSTIGDYMICSIRKWLPVSGGGVLYSNNSSIEQLSNNYNRSADNYKNIGMILKHLYINDKLNCNAEYREMFALCENMLDRTDKILLASDLSLFILGCFDTNEISNIRKQNYYYLKEKLDCTKYKTCVDLCADETPFSYVIRCENRDDLRQYLIDCKIYCAVHWPNDNIDIENRPQFIENSKTCLSIPIDHRYSKKHMDYIVKTLLVYGDD